MAFVDEAEKMIARYGWEERTVMPWAHINLKVVQIVKDCKDYDNCTSGSKDYLISLVNGLVPIMNSWEEYEHKPKAKVRIIKSGKITYICEDDLDMFDGLIEVIERG